MKNLNDNSYSKEVRGFYVIHVRKNLSVQDRRILLEATLKHLGRSSETPSIEKIRLPTVNLLSKTRSFEREVGAWRTLFGIRRRRSFVWGISEIYNQVKLSALDYVPDVYCYGYKKSRVGLVVATTLITEFKEHAISVMDFIQKYPDSKRMAIQASFNLISKHLNDNIMHLDPWAGNILVTSDLKKQWLVDFEYCKLNPRRSLEKKLGFCLGHFFKRKVCDHITWTEYTDVFLTWADEHDVRVDKKETIDCIQYYVEHRVGKKARFRYF